MRLLTVLYFMSPWPMPLLGPHERAAQKTIPAHVQAIPRPAIINAIQAAA